jgi:hypothetical protein
MKELLTVWYVASGIGQARNMHQIRLSKPKSIIVCQWHILEAGVIVPEDSFRDCSELGANAWAVTDDLQISIFVIIRRVPPSRCCLQHFQRLQILSRAMCLANVSG